MAEEEGLQLGNIGNAYAVLGGYRTGDKESAKEYLGSLTKTKYTLQNRAESRLRGRIKKKKYVMGQRLPRRTAV